MQVGVTFPQSEIGTDPEVIRDYAQAAEDLGYEHLLAYDHVLGADPSNREGWRGYTHKTMFHEPLTLFSYLAAITQRLELVSGVIVLPQRQSALVAKQAAEVDVGARRSSVAAQRMLRHGGEQRMAGGTHLTSRHGLGNGVLRLLQRLRVVVEEATHRCARLRRPIEHHARSSGIGGGARCSSLRLTSLFTQRRRIGILRTSPLRHSANFLLYRVLGS